MVLQVYLDPCTVNSRKVLAGLALMGTKYDFHHINYFTAEHKSDEYKKINPSATVPAATDGDLILTESNAILQYAADVEGGHSAYPQDLKKRAIVNRWLLWEASVWFPSCYKYLVEFVVKPLLKAQPDQSVIDAEYPRWNELATILDNQLSKTKWLTGDEITIADIAVAAPMHLHAASRLPLEKHAHLKRWLGAIEQLPSWQQTQPAVDKALVPNQHKDVKASFNYTKDVEQPVEIYFYESENSKGIYEPGDDPHEMEVADGWHRSDLFSVDKEGFSVHNIKTAYENWDNDDAVAKEFYPEVVEFLKNTQGAKDVLVFDHTIRSKNNAAKKLTTETGTSQRAPVMLVHCDYTAESGPVRVEQLMGDKAKELLSRRLAFFNVWKPIRRNVEENPLAMCDVTSSPPADFKKLFLRYRDRTGENYVMRHSPQHKWWYFPNMTPEQAIVLKTYDSATDGRARFVGHSAFADPTSAPDAPYRESIEIRTIAFF